MSDGDWKSDAVRSYERRGKSGRPVPESTETPWIWLFLGLVGPPVLIVPLSFVIILALAWIQKNLIHVVGVVNAHGSGSTSLHVMEALILGAVAACALPCILGLKRYEDKKFVAFFAAGFGVSYLCTAVYFFHWVATTINPWTGTHY